MAGETAAHHDRDKIYLERFDQQLRAHLRTLVTPALIEEYRANPLGQHSGDLERVLNYFRRAPFEGKYVLFELEANRKVQDRDHHGRGGRPAPGRGRHGLHRQERGAPRGLPQAGGRADGERFLKAGG